MSERDRVCVVLVAPRNPLNIGAVARAMSNFGFHRLRVAHAYAPSFREARSAVGASAVLEKAEEYTSVGDAVADCTLVVGASAAHHRELNHPVKRLEQGARLIRKELAKGHVAILFGSEKTGLSNADLSHCHWVMRIPTREEHGSMNLGQAVAVCLYELARDARRSEAVEKPKRARAAEVERITAVLLDALRVSGYLKPRSATATEEKIRRMVCRLDLQADDAQLWLGMLRQMLWKMRTDARK